MAVKQVKHSLHFVSLFMFQSKKKKLSQLQLFTHSNRTAAYIWEVMQISFSNWLGKYTSLYFLKAIYDFSTQRTGESNPNSTLFYFYFIFFSNAFPFKIGSLDLAPVLSSFKSSVPFLFQLYCALECPLSEEKNPPDLPPSPFSCNLSTSKC